mgnify:CR=1 FL=1
MKFLIKTEDEYVNSKNLTSMACSVPFRHIEIHPMGDVSACCHTWLPVWVGNLYKESVADVVNNVTRKEIQREMRCGNFEHCNDQCPQLSSYLSNTDDYWDIVPIEELNDKLDITPMNVGFSYDLSCNLQCPSCRNSLIMWDPNDTNDAHGVRVGMIHEKVKQLVSLLAKQYQVVNLNITGSGDAFASPTYWGYLVELAENGIPDNVFLNLKTNGIMMTKENWEDIKPIWDHISYIEVSVDAATEEAYKIVRKNGNFKRLKNNLDTLDQMILDGCFPNLLNWQTNIIVQRDNYKDLKPFVDWQLSYKSMPLIWTNLLAQWKHIEDERFKGMAIWQDGHVNKNELLEILKDPVFRDPRIMIGNLSSLLPPL